MGSENDFGYEQFAEGDIDLHQDSISSGKNISDYNSSVWVYIDGKVKEYIEGYADSNTTCELGGVLLGSYQEEENNSYIVNVDAAIKALHTDAGISDITFTHQTWEHIYNVKEEKYPDKKIIGWFHTHPGFGIFLSEYDQFILKNFFKYPWQIAYVVDPVRKKHGFFGFSNQNIIKVPFQVQDQQITSSVLKQRQDRKMAGLFGLKLRKKFISRSIWIVFLVLTILGFYYHFKTVAYYEDNVHSLNNNILEKETVITGLRKDVESLNEKLRVYENNRTLQNDITKSLDGNSVNENGQLSPNEQNHDDQSEEKIDD